MPEGLVGEALPGALWPVEVPSVLGVDDAMDHERVQREERRDFYDVLVDHRVSVRYPPFACRAFRSRKVVVVSSSPDSVGREQPKWGWPRPGRQIYEHFLAGFAQLGDQLDGRVKVLHQGLLEARGVANAIELEQPGPSSEPTDDRVAKVAIVLRDAKTQEGGLNAPVEAHTAGLVLHGRGVDAGRARAALGVPTFQAPFAIHVGLAAALALLARAELGARAAAPELGSDPLPRLLSHGDVGPPGRRQSTLPGLVVAPEGREPNAQACLPFLRPVFKR
mmetsp:Transcript_75892/g.217251  ORF Transcript_75892/g.217251 Transcript_75892/m.217251 type:complete len:278 (-) Transcript_75892:1185-2018(-)